MNSDVIDTLVALGYSVVEAQMAVQAMPSDAPADVEERVRALKGLTLGVDAANGLPHVEERVRLALQYFA